MEQHNWTNADVDVTRHGSKIVLPSNPDNMPLRAAIEQLERKEKDEEEVNHFIETIEGYPLDGAVAFMKAMQRTFGWASGVKIPPKNMFDSEHPPAMVGVEIAPGETIQVPFGRFTIPNVEGFFQTEFAVENGSPCLQIHAMLKKKDAPIAHQVAKLTREIIANESIYKGKAIHLRTDSDGDLAMNLPPKFIDTAKIDRRELILNDDVSESVGTSIFNPIRYTKQCRKAQIPLKRHALLDGIYGVGKTMIARLTALECEENGWTYIMVDRPEALTAALVFAKRYAPAVVFCEDIDRITEERDDDANDLLNTIDGVLSKDSEIITVMTTNHLEKINPAMLRPGRQDAVIRIAPPNADSVQRLVRLYGRGMVSEDEDLEPIGRELAGQIPASIREVVERSKLRAIPKMTNGKLYISQDDLLGAAREMKAHLALLAPKPPAVSPVDKIKQGIFELLGDSPLSDQLEDLSDRADDLSDRADDIYEQVA